MTLTSWPSLFRDRQNYSQDRLQTMKAELESLEFLNELSDLAVFAAGSYARGEASEHSDLDLFFIYAPNTAPSSRSAEIQLFASLIGMGKRMSLPAFSSDSRYLSTLTSDDLFRVLGSPEDDSGNYFTLRMLLILESRPLLNEGSYLQTLNEVVRRYFRDYPDHESSFEPLFLINDIMRYWKTMLLNYENRRRTSGNEVARAEQKTKNFKLKYSRMTTCFATIGAIAALPSPVSPEQIVELTQLRPQERLDRVVDAYPTTRGTVNSLRHEYQWFLEQTSKSKEELEKMFQGNSSRTAEMFKRAAQYGDSLFAFLVELDEAGQRNLLRYLVV